MESLRNVFWKATTIVVVLSTLVAAVPARAATVTAANDYPTSLSEENASDHTVVFTTPTGYAEGSNFILQFATEFDTSSIVEDDIDVADDGVDLTTAANCAGAEQASVLIAADAITVTICAGDGGAIAGGSEVTVEIGTNATASGIGVNRIVNPPDAGEYYISIEGSGAGDTGTIVLPIGTERFIVVARVGGSGQTPGPGVCDSDTTPPTITQGVVSNITTSSARISWTTNENADSNVDYGLTTSYELGTVSNPSLDRAHSIQLSGLSEGETYHFRVRSADACDNERISGDFTFTTLDETACVIADVDVVDITATTARVVWTTNEPASSVVAYGLTTSYTSAETDGTLETDHSLVLSGLSDSTLYHYRVGCRDASGNVGYSPDGTFETQKDLPPSNVTDFNATERNASCALSWNNPSDDDLAGVSIWQCQNDYPSAPNDADCSEVFDGLSESTTVSGLTNGTTYYYGAFAYDEAGQFASGALEACSPRTPEEELPPAEELPPGEELPPAEGGSGFCGDAVCSELESADSCPADCAAEPPVEEETEVIPPVEIPPTTVGGQELIPETDVEFFVAGGSIQLSAASSAEVRMLSHRPLRVQVLTRNIQKDVDRVQLVFGADAYNMALNDSGRDGEIQAASFGDPAYVADVVTPSSAAYAMVISILYTDGTAQTLSFLANVEEDGYTFENVEGTVRRVPGASVTLFENGVVTWDGSPFGQFNPSIADEDGAFGWYVPNGTYTVEAEKSGFESALSGTLLISDNIVNPAVRMVAQAVTPLEEVPILGEAIQAIETVNEVLQTIRESEQVETAATVAVPALVATAVVSTAALATTFNLIPFLQYLFTSPFLFVWRRKRKGFGVVYNSLSKVPIDLAIVRLYRLPDVLPEGPLPAGQLVQSRVTDKGGRYFFLIQPGNYKITATKAGFTFPTAFLAKSRNDGEFLDVYHAEVIRVTDSDAVLTANIPLDPIQVGEHQKPAKIRFVRHLRIAQHVLAVGGILVSIGVLVVRPSMLAAVLVGVQVGVYLLVRRLATAKKPKSWGIVYDKATQRPLSNVVVRIFEPTYNKLLETTVTDSKGRYSALLGPNEYFSVYEREGYETTEVRPINYKQKKEPTELAINVALAPK